MIRELTHSELELVKRLLNEHIKQLEVWIKTMSRDTPSLTQRGAERDLQLTKITLTMMEKGTTISKLVEELYDTIYAEGEESGRSEEREPPEPTYNEGYD